MPTFHMRGSRRHEEVLTRVELPDGSASSGLLVSRDGRLTLVLYAQEDVKLGDEVVAPPDRRFTVASVRHETLDGRTVTRLDVRSSG